MLALTLRASRLSIDDEGIALFEDLPGEARNPLSMALRTDYAAQRKERGSP